jgi:hypothetical protein
LSENILASVTILQWCKGFDATLGSCVVSRSRNTQFQVVSIEAIA